MSFSTLAIILGLCSVFEIATSTTLTLYGYKDYLMADEDKNVAFKPSKINDVNYFLFMGAEFTKGEPSYYTNDFLLVYKPSDAAENIDAFVVKGGLRNMFKTNQIDDVLKKNLLSEDYCGFTPAMALLHGSKEFYHLRVIGKNTQGNRRDIPVLYIRKRGDLTRKLMIRNTKVLGKYSVSKRGISEESYTQDD